MPLNRSLLFQLIILFIFASVFINGSLLLNNFVLNINQEKSIYPILVYTNTLSEANDVLDFVKEHKCYFASEIISPDSLENMLIDKYNLSDYKDIAGDYKLPYQLEISVLPFKTEELLGFVNKIQGFFPNYLLHYNQEIWQNIDQQTNKLKLNIIVMQITALILYMALQFLLRFFLIINYRENISALINSGISLKSLFLKELINKFVFLVIAGFLIITINFLINYINLLTMISTNYSKVNTFLDLNLLVYLMMTNMILVFCQRPFFKKRKND